MKHNVETGLYPDPLTISHISMVGATAAELKVSGLDQWTLALALSAVSELGLDLSPAFDTFHFRKNKMFGRDITEADSHLIRKINLDPAEGGEDFLNPKTLTDTDLLVFCNIAHGNSERLKGGHVGQLSDKFRNQTLEQMNAMVLASLGQQNNSMQVSPLNDDDASWLSQIDKSGTKIAFFRNVSDDYPPERLGGDKFICVKDKRNNFRGVAIRRDFLEHASRALVDNCGVISHPLIKLAGTAQNSNQNVFSFDFSSQDKTPPILNYTP